MSLWILKKKINDNIFVFKACKGFFFFFFISFVTATVLSHVSSSNGTYSITDTFVAHQNSNGKRGYVWE